MYEQVLNKVTPEYSDKINLYEVNIEQEPEIAGLFKVMSVPTTTTISKSGDTYSQPGVLNEETLKYFLEGLLQKNKKYLTCIVKVSYIYIRCIK